MTLDRLRADLADLAREADVVAHVDRGSAIRRLSRRLHRNRALTASALVVVTMALFGTAAAVLSGSSRSTPPATPPFRAPLSVFYLNDEGQTLIRMTAEGSVRTMAERLYLGSALTAAMSPDGKHLAAVIIDDANGPTGPRRMIVTRHASFGSASFTPGYESIECSEPSWSGDSAQVLTAVSDPDTDHTRLLVVHVPDDPNGSLTNTPLDGDVRGCHFIWSADTATIAYSPGDGTIAITSRATGTSRTVPGLGASRHSFDPVSLSPDGGRVVLDVQPGPGGPDPDPTRSRTANTVIDTVTGLDVALPVPGSMIFGYYQADGLLVARVQQQDRIVVAWIAPDGTLVHQLTEPETLADATFIP